MSKTTNIKVLIHNYKYSYLCMYTQLYLYEKLLKLHI